MSVQVCLYNQMHIRMCIDLVIINLYFSLLISAAFKHCVLYICGNLWLVRPIDCNAKHHIIQSIKCFPVHARNMQTQLKSCNCIAPMHGNYQGLSLFCCFTELDCEVCSPKAIFEKNDDGNREQ